MLTLVALLLFAAPTEASAPSGSASERAGDTILVLRLRAIGVSAADASAATAQLAAALADQTDSRVVSAQDIDELVVHQRTLGAAACDDEACIAEMSRVANAELALAGSIGEIGGEHVLTLTLIDVVQSATVGSGSRSLASLDDLPKALPSLVAEVLGRPDPTGAAARPRYNLPAGHRTSLAVFDLEPLGIDRPIADNLTQVLAAELKGIDGASVISRADVASMIQIETEKERLDCADATGCLAEVGGALGVEKLVVGHAGRLGKTYVVSLRLIDTKGVRVDNRISESFTGEEEQLLNAVRSAGRRLLGVEATAPGTLAVSGSVTGAEVFLDARGVGALPLPPLEGLTPGRHSMRVAKEGFVDWRSDFYVDPAGTTALWAELTAAPEHWYEKWWVWTAVGGVVVAAVTTAVVVGVTSSQAPPSTASGSGTVGGSP